MSSDLPSQEELRQLPLRALAAYTARCVRRVQPLFHLPADYPERDCHLMAVDAAIRLSEERADGTCEVDVSGRDAGEAARAAGCAASSGSYSAQLVAAAAGYAADFPGFPATSAASNAALSDAHDAAAIDAAARADFERLKSLRLGRPGEIGQPVNATEAGPLGPLWPNGAPDWYAERRQKLDAELERIRQTQHPVEPAGAETEARATEPESDVGPPAFVIAWDPQVMTADEYVELVEILGDLVRANGGAGVRRLIEEDLGVVGAGVLQP